MVLNFWISLTSTKPHLRVAKSVHASSQRIRVYDWNGRNNVKYDGCSTNTAKETPNFRSLQEDSESWNHLGYVCFMRRLFKSFVFWGMVRETGLVEMKKPGGISRKCQSFHPIESFPNADPCRHGSMTEVKWTAWSVIFFAVPLFPMQKKLPTGLQKKNHGIEACH